MLVAHGKKYARLLKRHCSAETPTILDIGCAAGFLLKGFEEEGWRGVGIDANQTMVDYGKKQLGLDLRCQTIEKYAFNESERIDAAMMVQVLPHLSDPLAAIETVHKMLNEDGLVLIETWNYQSLTARAFRQSWHEYNPPSVLHWFSKSGLQSVLKESGFEIIKTGRPTKWISVGNGVSLIKHSLRTSTLGKIATLPLSVIPKSLKAPYFLDDVFWVLAKRKKR